MADLPDVPVRLRCTRCYEGRAVFARIDPEYGDYGSVIGGEPVYRLDPPCPGYVDQEQDPRIGIFGDSWVPSVIPWTDELDVPASEAWCPFDGQDDYQSSDEDKVWVARRHAREVIAAVNALAVVRKNLRDDAVFVDV